MLLKLDYVCLTDILNRSCRISTTPNTTCFFDHSQTYTAIYYGHSELSREEKSKFEFEEKKFSLLLKGKFAGVSALKTQLSVIN